MAGRFDDGADERTTRDGRSTRNSASSAANAAASSTGAPWSVFLAFFASLPAADIVADNDKAAADEDSETCGAAASLPAAAFRDEAKEGDIDDVGDSERA